MSGPLSVPLAVAAFYVTNEAAKALLVMTAIGCAVFSSYWVWSRERRAVAERESKINDLEMRLNALLSPNISMDKVEIRSEGYMSVAYITLTGLSASHVRLEVYCTGAIVTKNGNQMEISTKLKLTSGAAWPFTLAHEEIHSIAVIKYDEKDALAPIEVVSPSKRPYDEIKEGEEFLVTFAAFGAPTKVELSLRCGIRNDTLYVERASAHDVIKS